MRFLLAALFLSCAMAAPQAAPTSTDLPYGPAPEQRFDLHVPAGTGAAPLVLMVHGGGWFRGDKGMSRVVEHKSERWLPRGIAFASINYRMQPVAPPIEQARDVARALAEVQKNADKYAIDRNNIVLMGHSAGAHLIALLAARPELLAEAGARRPQGFVLLDSGALDVPAIMNTRHFPLYDRAFGTNPADWTAASPFQQFRQASAPILAVCSSRRANACPQADAFVAKARDLGTTAEVLRLDKSHGEINEQLGDDPDYTASVERFIRQLSPRFAERLR